MPGNEKRIPPPAALEDTEDTEVIQRRCRSSGSDAHTFDTVSQMFDIEIEEEAERNTAEFKIGFTTRHFFVLLRRG
jgi:hypothetical protein